MWLKIRAQMVSALFCILVCFGIKQAAYAQQKDSLDIENLVFEGAGIRGIAYCGALMELDERGYLDCISRVAGTSSGAITASLLAVGYSPDEIFEIVGGTDFGKFNDGSWGFVGGLVRLNSKLGFYRGKSFLRWLEMLITAKTNDPNITFEQLFQLKQKRIDCNFKDLAVAATSLNHQSTIIFSRESFPEMRIVDAVHASMAVPLYFEPVVIDTHGRVIAYRDMLPDHYLCVDGGFTANYMISAFDSAGIIAPTLGIRLDSDEQIICDNDDCRLAYYHVESVKDFVGAFYYIIKETMNRQSLTPEDWNRTVSISDCNIGPKVKKLSDEEKQKLIAAGRKGVVDHLNG
jgi:NTE family protein